jgi:hypothetical protein
MNLPVGQTSLRSAVYLVILVSFYSQLPIKTTPESREECELVG